MRKLLSFTLVGLLALASCAPGASQPTTSDAPTAAPTQPNAGRPFTLKENATIPDPWAMVFLPGTSTALITRKTGQLLLHDVATKESQEVSGVPAVHVEGQGGLGDVALTPTFAQDKGIYLSWVEQGEGGSGAVVGRATLDVASAKLSDVKVIWRQTPKQQGSGHFSHRLAVSPDGQYLFVSSGDRQKFDPAQDMGGNLGKVLRLNLDGTPASGNPWAEKGGVAAEFWTMGHRNVLGLAFAPDGALWASEMGPKGGDELNRILPGKNYGWPLVSNGSHYDGRDIPDHAAGDGFEAPKVWWNPSISPGNLLIYSGDKFPAWKGDALLGALSGQALIRVDLEGDKATKADEWPLGERIREVEQGPDGSVWLLEDGKHARLLEVVPAAG